MTKFIDLQLPERLIKATDKLGFESVTTVQEKVIPAALSGRDLLVCAKTGSGKTAAFVLPMLARFLAEDRPRAGTRGLILVPTRELALQVQKNIEQLAGFTGIRCGLIIGGEPFKYQIATIRKNPEIIVSTTGRLVEHLENKNIDFNDLECLVLDEADRMLEMGFAEDMHTIMASCNDEHQTLLFSATLNNKRLGALREKLKNPQQIVLESNLAEQNTIEQWRVLADDDKHKEKLAAAIVEQQEAKCVFIFCNTRKACQKVSNLMRAHKLYSEYIHGEMTQSERKQVMNRFRDGKIHVLVATDVAARGLDIQAVDLVINFDLAHSGDDHVHRIGRTGRAERSGLAVSLISQSEWDRSSSIERYLKFRFISKKIKGFEGSYSGPKKLKSSGKAVGGKKKKPSSGKKIKSSKSKPELKRKTLGDGSSPLKRK